MANKILRAGLLGISNYAMRAHIPYLIQDPNVKLIALARSNPNLSRLPLPENLHNIPVYPSISEMLASEELDFVVISTPPGVHYNQIETCLKQGIHILVDKAMVCSNSQANQIVSLAKKNKLLLSVATQRRYEEVYKYIKKTINSSELGKLVFVSAEYSRHTEQTFKLTWRNNSDLSWGGALADSGYHIVDSLLYVANLKPNQVFTSMSYDDLDVEKSAILNIKFENNTLGLININYFAPENTKIEKYCFYGEKATICLERVEFFNRVKQIFLFIDNHGNRKNNLIFPTKTNHSASIVEFVNALLNVHEILISDAESHIPTVSLIEAAYKAHSQNMSIQL